MMTRDEFVEMENKQLALAVAVQPAIIREANRLAVDPPTTLVSLLTLAATLAANNELPREMFMALAGRLGREHLRATSTPTTDDLAALEGQVDAIKSVVAEQTEAFEEHRLKLKETEAKLIQAEAWADAERRQREALERELEDARRQAARLAAELAEARAA